MADQHYDVIIIIGTGAGGGRSPTGSMANATRVGDHVRQHLG